MKKRILALLCTAAVALGVCALAVMPAQATDEAAYFVGYSKKDTNPWADPTDHSKGILLPDKDANGEYIIDADGNYKDGIPLAGYGSVQTRPALNMLDDNGDGVVDDKDGLFATCTAVTDTQGTTMLFITIDAISPAEATVKTLRSEITAAIRALGGELYADQIMISGSHSHTGPDLYTLSVAKEDTNPKQYQYYRYYINQIVAAAKEAYESRAEAVMTKTTVDASDAIFDKYGVQTEMNTIRHYAMDATLQYVKGSAMLKEVADPQIVCGANFGMYHTYDYMQLRNPWTHTFAKEGDYSYNMVVSGQSSVATADDSMDLLKFEVKDSDEPILLINWQTHPDNIGGNNVSSDYIGGLRYRLENNKSEFNGKQNYRVSFIQGAAGNLAPRNAVGAKTWQNLSVAGLKNPNLSIKDDLPFIKYGYLLAETALSALEDGFAAWSRPLTGSIKTKQITYAADRQVYSEGLHAAAEAYYADIADGVLDSDADGVNEFPYAYDYNGQRYILSSAFHANKIRNQTRDTAVNIELNAILLGEGLAMVSAPNELFDRYNSDGAYKDGAYNAWAKLENEIYGTPLVLGYSNGHQGYIANIAAYRYNETAIINGKPVLSIGSYEANNSNFAEGVGEKLMDVYAQLLKDAAAGDAVIEGWCEGCKTTADWHTLDSNVITASADLRSCHYRLTEDLSLKTQLKVIPGNTVCLDLNGHTLDNGYSSLLTVGGKTGDRTATLNIQESQGGGKLSAPSRVVYVTYEGAVNMYGGTLETTAVTPVADQGGTVYVTHNNAVFNLYNGTILGGNVTDNGGAVYLWSNADETKAQFNIYGGTVWGGAAKTGATIACLQSQLGLYGGTVMQGSLTAVEGAKGNCIYSSSSLVYLSGSGYVDNITCGSLANTLYLTDDSDIRIPGGITSTVAFGSTVDVGDVSNSAKLLSGIAVYDKTGAKKYLSVSGSDLKLSNSDTTAQNVSVNGQLTTLSQAIENYTLADKAANITAIQLMNDIAALTVSKDVCIDLNGHNISSVNVTGNATLYVMDSTTDDYDAPAQRCCGQLGATSGNVQAVPSGFGCVDAKGEDWYSGYVAVTIDGSTSFHRVDFGITNTDLNPGKLGLRYGCAFFGDQIIADNFDGQYGIAVSIKADPAVSGTLDLTYSTSFSTFHVGGNTGSASYIANILSTDNVYTANRRNGETKIYGRPYLSLNGQVIYGPLEKTSLKESLQTINAGWDNITLQALKDQTYAMFNTFESVMQKWNLDAIEAGARSYQ